MHYLLDTNVCVVYLNGRSTKVRDRLLATPLNEMAVCSGVKSVGTPIGAYDLQIAAIAMVNGLTLVTHNTREFDRVEGLRLEDWALGV
ncbi:putative nucleic acid-binding protein [Leptolyngbya sp. PCC 7375]|nr:putative nucleic acid-binding protein [Leptolyngbya sp. PCC 7375]